MALIFKGTRTMNTQWHINEASYQLHRYPKGQHHNSLQAWDSADEYLVNWCQELDKNKSLLILNDQFGALSVALNGFTTTVVTDSKVAELAIEQNCAENNLTVPAILNSLMPLPAADVVLIRLTNNIGYLEHQLNQIAQLPDNTTIVAAGKTTLVTKNVMALFERLHTNVSSSLAKKKSRLIFASSKRSENVATKPFSVYCEEIDKNIKSYANVFSKEQIDIGGRFLLKNLPKLNDNDQVIDLGCGNGLLGLGLLDQVTQSNKDIKLSFVDESNMAVASAKLNVSDLYPNLLNCCEFLQQDCLSDFADNQADTVLCNPPFHQQNTVTEHIAEQMISQSYQKLKSGGQLLLVANKHLGYEKKLQQLFGFVTLVNQNNKFKIYSAIKK